MDLLGRNLAVAPHQVPDMSAKMGLPWQRPLPSNGRCLATALWTFSSYGRLEAERVNQF